MESTSAGTQALLSADDLVAVLGSSLIAGSHDHADPAGLYADAAADLAALLRPPGDDGVLCFHPDLHERHGSPMWPQHFTSAHSSFSANSTSAVPGPADRLLCPLVPHAVVADALAAYITRRFLPRSAVDVGPWLGAPMSSALPRSVLTAVPLAHAHRLADRWRRKYCAKRSRILQASSTHRESDKQEDRTNTDEVQKHAEDDADKEPTLADESEGGSHDEDAMTESVSGSGCRSRRRQQQKRARDETAELTASVGHTSRTAAHHQHDDQSHPQRQLEMLCDVFPHQAITALVAEVPRPALDLGLYEEEGGCYEMQRPFDPPLCRWVRLRRLAELWRGFGRTLTADAVAALVLFQQHPGTDFVADAATSPDAGTRSECSRRVEDLAGDPARRPARGRGTEGHSDAVCKTATDMSTMPNPGSHCNATPGGDTIPERCLVSAAVEKIRGVLASLATQCVLRWERAVDHGPRCALCEANCIDPSTLKSTSSFGIGTPTPDVLAEWQSAVHAVLLLVSIGDAGRRGEVGQLLSTLAERAVRHQPETEANDGGLKSTELAPSVSRQEGGGLSVRAVMCDPAASATAMARALSHVTHRCPLTAAALGAAGLLDTVAAVTVDLDSSADPIPALFPVAPQQQKNLSSAVLVPPSTTWLRIGNDEARVDFTSLRHLTTLEVADPHCVGLGASFELVAAIAASCPQLHTLRLTMPKGGCGGRPVAPETVAEFLHPGALAMLKADSVRLSVRLTGGASDPPTDAEIFQKLSGDMSASAALVVLGLWKVPALTSLALHGSIMDVHADAGLAHCLGLRSLYIEFDCSTTVPPLPSLTTLELSGHAAVADLALFPALRHFTGDRLLSQAAQLQSPVVWSTGRGRRLNPGLDAAAFSPHQTLALPPLLSYSGAALPIPAVAALTSLTRLKLTEPMHYDSRSDMSALANLRHLEHVWLCLLTPMSRTAASEFGAAWGRALRTCTFASCRITDNVVVPFIVALGPQPALRSLALRSSDVSSFSIAAAAVCLPQLRSLFVATEAIRHPDELSYLAATFKAAAADDPIPPLPPRSSIHDATGMTYSETAQSLISAVVAAHPTRVDDLQGGTVKNEQKESQGSDESASRRWFPMLESLVLEGVLPSDRFIATICGAVGCQHNLKRFAFGARDNIGSCPALSKLLTVESFTAHLPRLIALRHLVMFTPIHGAAFHTTEEDRRRARRGARGYRTHPMRVLEVAVAEDSEGNCGGTSVRRIPKAAVLALAERLPLLAQCTFASDVCEVTGELQPALDYSTFSCGSGPKDAMSSKQRHLNEIARVTSAALSGFDAESDLAVTPSQICGADGESEPSRPTAAVAPPPTADSVPSVTHDSAAFERSEMPWRPLLTARGPRPIRPDGQGLWDPLPMVYRNHGDSVVFLYDNDGSEDGDQ